MSKTGNKATRQQGNQAVPHGGVAHGFSRGGHESVGYSCPPPLKRWGTQQTEPGAQATGVLAPRSRSGLGFSPARSRSAFTLVELLVVIVVIGVLAGVILTISSRVLGQQKVNTTKNTMRLVGLAIDQFTAEDPLKPVYNSRNNRTFGPYPPYQLKGGQSAFEANNVAQALEPFHPLLGNAVPASLEVRLARDLSGIGVPNAPTISHWVNVQDENANDDIRSLYAYLAAYSPGVLEQIPESVIKRLTDRSDPEFINPTGQGTDSGDPGAIDVFGFYDAWDVPLDYLLYVKVEYGMKPSATTPQWMVTDRVAVLRSRGITAEEVAHGVVDPQQALYSVLLPQPAANVHSVSGVFLTPRRNGWSRAVAEGDDYKYVPEQ